MAKGLQLIVQGSLRKKNIYIYQSIMYLIPSSGGKRLGWFLRPLPAHYSDCQSCTSLMPQHNKYFRQNTVVEYLPLNYLCKETNSKFCTAVAGRRGKAKLSPCKKICTDFSLDLFWYASASWVQLQNLSLLQ